MKTNKELKQEKNYIKPDLKKIEIDKQISLVMTSDGATPPEDPEAYFSDGFGGIMNPFK